MSPLIREEGWFLLYSVLLGIGITFVYDCLRICRRVVAHGIVWISLEDLLYWVFVSFCIFDLLYYENDGAFRWFAILGAALGMVLFKKTISPVLVTFVSNLLLRIRKQLEKGIAFVRRPVCRIGRRAAKRTRGLCRKAAQFLRILKKRLTVGAKMATMTLSRRCRKETKRRRK